jgi:hypothetical protein
MRKIIIKLNSMPKRLKILTKTWGKTYRYNKNIENKI